MATGFTFPTAIADKVGYTQGETGLHSTSPTNRPIRPVGNPGVDETTCLARSGTNTVTPIESGKIFDCANGTIMIIPQGLTNWSAIFLVATGGSITIRPGTGVLINGATADIVVAQSSNLKGISLIPRATLDSYLL